jgi:hypothetical protein
LEIATNNKEIQRIIRDYFEKLYYNKLENIEEMEKFLDINEHPKLNQEDINHLNRSIIHNEIEAATKSLPEKIIHDWMDCLLNFSRPSKKN